MSTTENKAPDGALLRYKDVAAMLRITERSVFTLASSGELPRLKVGGSVRFRRSDVLDFIERCAEEGGDDS